MIDAGWPSKPWGPTVIDFSHSIYRDEAVRQYAPDREWQMSTRLAVHPFLPSLGIVLVLVAVALVGAWLTEVPVYASGSAVVVAAPPAAAGGDFGDGQAESDVMVVAFVPSDSLGRLRVGQTLWLSHRASGERISQPIVAVEPEVRSPNAARQRFGLGGGTADELSGPVAVAVAQFAPQPRTPGLSTDAYLGGVYDASVEIGSRRVLTLLPLLGHVGE